MPDQAPDFYERVPPAPPGLEWWKYRSDVPPLPQPAKYFHSKKYADWGARHDCCSLLHTAPCLSHACHALAPSNPVFLISPAPQTDVIHLPSSFSCFIAHQR